MTRRRRSERDDRHRRRSRRNDSPACRRACFSISDSRCQHNAFSQPKRKAGHALASLVGPEAVELLAQHVRFEQPAIGRKELLQLAPFRPATVFHRRSSNQRLPRPNVRITAPARKNSCRRTSSRAAAACSRTWNLSNTILTTQANDLAQPTRDAGVAVGERDASVRMPQVRHRTRRCAYTSVTGCSAQRGIVPRPFLGIPHPPCASSTPRTFIASDPAASGPDPQPSAWSVRVPFESVDAIPMQAQNPSTLARRSHVSALLCRNTERTPSTVRWRVGWRYRSSRRAGCPFHFKCGPQTPGHIQFAG
jgi:hypothetical protein